MNDNHVLRSLAVEADNVEQLKASPQTEEEAASRLAAYQWASMVAMRHLTPVEFCLLGLLVDQSIGTGRPSITVTHKRLRNGLPGLFPRVRMSHRHLRRRLEVLESMGMVSVQRHRPFGMTITPHLIALDNIDRSRMQGIAGQLAKDLGDPSFPARLWHDVIPTVH